MPIVASIGGNTGNQTVALVVRGLALDQITAKAPWHLLRKELLVAFLNGRCGARIVGLFATIVYRSTPLGLVMTSAVLINLIIAALSASRPARAPPADAIRPRVRASC